MYVPQEMYEAEVEFRAEEARKLWLEREAVKAARDGKETRAWRWSVEPGMEGVFRSLMGWLLPSKGEEGSEAEQPVGPGRGAPAAVPVEGEDSEWGTPPLPYCGWSCYA
jgi:hypothetical protein